MRELCPFLGLVHLECVPFRCKGMVGGIVFLHFWSHFGWTVTQKILKQESQISFTYKYLFMILNFFPFIMETKYQSSTSNIKAVTWTDDFRTARVMATVLKSTDTPETSLFAHPFYFYLFLRQVMSSVGIIIILNNNNMVEWFTLFLPLHVMIIKTTFNHLLEGKYNVKFCQ